MKDRVKDRLPPFDQSAELAVIGSCLQDPVTAMAYCGTVITAPEFFYDVQCRETWEVMQTMDPQDINIFSLPEKMVKIMDKTAARLFLIECQDHAPSAANLSYWLESLQEKFTLRRIIQTAQRAIKMVYEETDANATLDTFERETLSIRPLKNEQQDIKSLMMQAQTMIEYRAQNWESITGLSTGLPSLDKLSDGLHKGEMVVIAALPSCGKTALAVNMAIHNAMRGIPVGILSAEMRPVQLVIRSICSESRVNFKRMGENDIAKMIPVAGKMARAPIYIQQANGWTIGQAQACARRWKQQYGIEMLLADYIQKFYGEGDNREQRVASIGSGLKDTAMELEIPVVALSQLNEDGRLRESRALGQDGDSVWKLANDGDWKPDVQPVKLRIEKCRDGETGEIDLTFMKTYTRFEEASKINDDEKNGYSPD